MLLRRWALVGGFILTLALGVMPGCNLFVQVPDPGQDDDGGGNDDGDDGVDTSQFASFTDPDDPSFSTVDIRDVDEEIVRFHTENRSIVWTEDGSEYQTGSWVVSGNFLGAGQSFQVRFGTKDGQRRAYFTETGPATICNIEAGAGGIQISATTVLVPQE